MLIYCKVENMEEKAIMGRFEVLFRLFLKCKITIWRPREIYICFQFSRAD